MFFLFKAEESLSVPEKDPRYQYFSSLKSDSSFPKSETRLAPELWAYGKGSFK